MDKQLLRHYIRSEKNKHTVEERRLESEAIWRRLEEYPLFQAAHTILAYHALPDEVQTDSLLERWYGYKRFVLPVVCGDELELRLYTGETDMQTGAFGIREPNGEPFTTFDELDLMLIPGMAFDADGHRLGRGKGFYDRLLARLRPYGIPTLGICFDYQRVACVPTETHDFTMDALL